MGLLLWGRTEVNPGFTPLFSFGYGFDRLIFGFTFKIKIRFFNWVLQPGRTQQRFPHSSKPWTLGAIRAGQSVFSIGSLMNFSNETRPCLIRGFSLSVIFCFFKWKLATRRTSYECPNCANASTLCAIFHTLHYDKTNIAHFIILFSA